MIIFDEKTRKTTVWVIVGALLLIMGWLYDDNLRYEQKYKEGKKYGPCIEWHKNGQLKKEEQYKQGKLYGESKAWYENGQLKDSVYYLNGYRNGLRKEWHENGQLKHQSMNHLIMVLDQKTQENVWKHWTSDEKNWDEFGYEIE